MEMMQVLDWLGGLKAWQQIGMGIGVLIVLRMLMKVPGKMIDYGADKAGKGLSYLWKRVGGMKVVGFVLVVSVVIYGVGELGVIVYEYSKSNKVSCISTGDFVRISSPVTGRAGDIGIVMDTNWNEKKVRFRDGTLVTFLKQELVKITREEAVIAAKKAELARKNK